VDKTENVAGAASNYAYAYDELGQLLTVKKNGALVEEYRYNTNGVREYEMNSQRGIAGRTFTYSDEDHLLSAGDNSYQYNLDGFLTTKTEGTDVTAYDYSSRGELLSVTLPDATAIEYIHDPKGRRIAKKVNGVIVEKYLWQGLTRLLAVYDGSNNIKSRFHYADGRMPVSMNQGSATYYFGYNQVGSLRAVFDSAGNIVKKIDYDSFGNILVDSNPTFTVPFGFAGGLHDRDINLVRFGFRDYDPEVGRWTAKDPIGFAGGDVDLYGYVLADPVNKVDPFGLFDWVSPITYWSDALGGTGDFIANYQDMRDANTIGADKYFHCMANCESARRGLGGRDISEAISESRELFDEYIKGDPRLSCDADRAANDQGRNGDTQQTCSQVCSSLRPNGLP
jgi:RHS repeat-associated protein